MSVTGPADENEPDSADIDPRSYVRNPCALWRSTLDRTTVLWESQFHELRGAAEEVWHVLSSPATATEISEHFSEPVGSDATSLRRELTDLLRVMTASGLIWPTT